MAIGYISYNLHFVFAWVILLLPTVVQSKRSWKKACTAILNIWRFSAFPATDKQIMKVFYQEYSTMPLLHISCAYYNILWFSSKQETHQVWPRVRHPRTIQCHCVHCGLGKKRICHRGSCAQGTKQTALCLTHRCHHQRSSSIGRGGGVSPDPPQAAGYTGLGIKDQGSPIQASVR